MRVDSNQPVNTISAADQNNFVCFDFINADELIIGDQKGSFTMARKITEPEKTEIAILKTKSDRFKEIRVFPNGKAVVTISHDGKISIWNIDDLRQYGKDIVNVKAEKTIKSK